MPTVIGVRCAYPNLCGLDFTPAGCGAAVVIGVARVVFDRVGVGRRGLWCQPAWIGAGGADPNDEACVELPVVGCAALTPSYAGWALHRRVAGPRW